MPDQDARADVAVKHLDWPVDVLGLLTIAVYGSWYYGFGVLIDDIGAALSIGRAQLGVAFGFAQLLLGLLSVVTGRALDRFGPVLVLSVVGPIGALLIALSGRAQTPAAFILCFSIGGGLAASAGFYGMTQSIIVRLDQGAATHRIIRLTIWGAFASPVAIPATEALRRNFDWRVAIQVPAVIALLSFVVSATVLRHTTIAPTSSATPQWSRALRSAFESAAIRWHAAGVFLAFMAMSTLLVFQLSILRWAGLSAGVAAGFAGARGLLQLLGRLPLRRALARFGHWGLLFAARGCVGLACLIIVLSGRPIIAAVYVVVAGVGIGAISALDGIVAREVIPVQDFGAISGVITLLGAIGGGVAPILAGRLIDASGSPASASVLAACAAVGAMYAVIATNRNHARRR